MGHRFAALATALLMTLILNVNATARCACSCVEGAPLTICTTAEEAATNPDYCSGTTLECSTGPAGDPPPDDTAQNEPDPSVSPPAGATACRDAVVEGFGTRTVCEVETAGSNDADTQGNQAWGKARKDDRGWSQDKDNEVHSWAHTWKKFQHNWGFGTNDEGDGQ